MVVVGRLHGYEKVQWVQSRKTIEVGDPVILALVVNMYCSSNWGCMSMVLLQNFIYRVKPQFNLQLMLHNRDSYYGALMGWGGGVTALNK